MNQASETYWKQFWQGNEPATVTAWKFGADPDHLADLVLKGIKTATCSAYLFYELEHETLPKVGEFNIILNSQDEPACITRTIDVTVMPMNEVPASHAYAEGEGDRSYRYWYAVHEEFFKKELAEIGRTFRNDMLVVCERFKVVDCYASRI
ncbi:ASCH domain-containing protein [Sporolactobacillus kofuensis]|uniref:ASCH domain-containing protein n=1 Tax=Sporolactobacillus kofuensis TaxID=269672 RepID=A0ABW1WFV1_9BACL|nr:ASCH domain-containing protein [Sporolactobacillus kofuensis]